MHLWDRALKENFKIQWDFQILMWLENSKNFNRKEVMEFFLLVNKAIKVWLAFKIKEEFLMVKANNLTSSNNHNNNNSNLIDIVQFLLYDLIVIKFK